MKVNYFVYVVGTDHEEGAICSGEVGVGYTSISPGICDCPYGTMYIAPTHIVPHSNPSEFMIRRAVLQYYGVRDRMDY
tara:strand:- start:405 stop:638 length:234 start_codon:yes stop_codon:yes gene_type:complete